MDANQQREQEQIRTFRSVTGAPESVARKFLEEAVWDLNLASSNFYNSDQAKTNYNPPPVVSQPQVPQVSQPSSTPVRTGPRIATLGSLSDDNGNDPKYYAGGKQSGIQVQGRPEDQNPSLVDKIFKKKSDPIPEPQEAPKNFGTGYRLGNTQTAPVVPMRDTVAEPEENPNITITFWRQGFVVDDGPLRKYDEPQNQAFLKDIDEGVVPQELRSRMTRNSRAANVSLVDKKSSDYEEPIVAKPKVISFSGSAHKLGDSSSIPQVKNETPNPSTSGNSSGGEAKVQIRMADGTILRATFGMDQTIGDIRSYIDQNKPQSKPYSLLTPFPRAVLSNLSQTIREADLNNA